VSHGALFDPEDERTMIFRNTRTYRPNNATPRPASFALVSRRVILVVIYIAGSNVDRLDGYTNRGKEVCQGASRDRPTYCQQWRNATERERVTGLQYFETLELQLKNTNTNCELNCSFTGTNNKCTFDMNTNTVYIYIWELYIKS